MFGYVIANYELLTDEEKKIYHSYYCGLCRSLERRHGELSRLTLTYDMTFLILLLSSLYEARNPIRMEHCLVHPIQEHPCCQNHFTNYGADMNLILSYYHFLDDWEDDRKAHAFLESKIFKSECKTIQIQYPRQCTTIHTCLSELNRIEKAGILNPDIPANCFGRLMSELFVIREDVYADRLRQFGFSLGKFIYILDACLDLTQDLKKERYNPMISCFSSDFPDILHLLMGQCMTAFQSLSIPKNRNLLENILYSGIWTRYKYQKQKKKKKK